jgi:L-cysteine desulfidase
MNTTLWNGFLTALKKDVVPALGCTEPVSVALAAAIARRKLGASPIYLEAWVSPNLMKNGMGVGIPGTGMVGLPIAAAMGALVGDADSGLEVLKNVTPQDVHQADLWLKSGSVTIDVANTKEPLFAKVTLSDGHRCISVTIAKHHTHVIQIEESGVTTYLESEQEHLTCCGSNPFDHATVQDIVAFALNVPMSDIVFMQAAADLNCALSEEGLSADYGLKIGATFRRHRDRGLLSAGLLTDILMRTSAASDARMAGAMKPAMSNSGSGNQGIAATLPVIVVAEYVKASPEKMIRALVLSHLMAIYIKSYQQKLSALCGATTASMGAVAGMTWLLDGDMEAIEFAICNMIGDVAGVICDGAKPACAMKVSSSAGAAVKAALMAIDGIRVSEFDGIVAKDVNQTIRNLSQLANGSMMQTDVQILDIMMKKTH